MNFRNKTFPGYGSPIKRQTKGGKNVPKTNFPMPRKTYKVVKRDKLKCKIIPSHKIIHFG